MLGRLLSFCALDYAVRRAALPARTGALALGAAAGLLAGCGGEDRTVVFGEAVQLLSDPGPGAPIFTSSIRAAGPSAGDGPILVAEPMSGRILSLADCASGCREEVVEGGLGLPVRAAHADLDRDGADELLVADIGELSSSDAKKGRVLVAGGSSEAEVLVDGVARLVRAEPADLDGDGDTDVLGCAFGSQAGEIFWAENEDGAFVRRTLDPLAGASDAFAFDADGDGDLDVAAQISQSTEEVNLYRNKGDGEFAKENLFGSSDDCHGLSSLSLADLDLDGDTDLLVTNGDDMDLECHGPYYADQHGLVWMENDGLGRFERREILGMYGAYVVRPSDLDGDGDVDLVLASYSWDPEYTPPEGFAPLVWLENDGRQRFTRHDIQGAPSALLAMEVTDVDEDGVPDILTGSADPLGVMPDLRRLVVLHGEWVPR